MRLIIAGTRGLGTIPKLAPPPGTPPHSLTHHLFRQNEHYDHLVAAAAASESLDLSRVSQVISGRCPNSPDAAGEAWACYEHYRRTPSKSNLRQSFLHSTHDRSTQYPDPIDEQDPHIFLITFAPQYLYYDKIGKDRRSAPKDRNTEMALYASTASSTLPDANDTPALLAIWDGLSRGTEHMIEQATEYGLDIFIHITDKESANDPDRFPISPLDNPRWKNPSPTIV